jgi:hypothetical protein
VNGDIFLERNVAREESADEGEWPVCVGLGAREPRIRRSPWGEARWRVLKTKTKRSAQAQVRVREKRDMASGKWKGRIKQTYRTDASQPHRLEQHHAARVGRMRHVRRVQRVTPLGSKGVRRERTWTARSHGGDGSNPAQEHVSVGLCLCLRLCLIVPGDGDTRGACTASKHLFRAQHRGRGSGPPWGSYWKEIKS